MQKYISLGVIYLLTQISGVYSSLISDVAPSISGAVTAPDISDILRYAAEFLVYALLAWHAKATSRRVKKVGQKPKKEPSPVDASGSN
jgi:hypothetical protein